MSIATFVKDAFTAVNAARPVSHAAALSLLGTSIYAVHEGASSVLPIGLTAATTTAMVGLEWLQWTALGRLAKIEEAGDDVRAFTLKAQCVGIGGLQVLLYSLAVVNFAREAGADWSQGWTLMGTIAIALLFAALNFSAKFNSCDPVQQPRRSSSGPTGGQRIHDAIFSAPALPAPVANDDVVISFDLERAIREKTARMEAAEALALEDHTRPAFKTPALERFVKRTKLRQRRATQVERKAAAA